MNHAHKTQLPKSFKTYFWDVKCNMCQPIFTPPVRLYSDVGSFDTQLLDGSRETQLNRVAWPFAGYGYRQEFSLPYSSS